MADAVTTLAGLVTLNDQNALHIGITNLVDDAPVVAALNAQPASNGTLHKYERITVAEGSAFRAVGAGRTLAGHQVELVTDTLTILDASFVADVALAQAYMAGRDAYMQKRLILALRAAFFDVESQIFQGTGHDASGFGGLINEGTLDALADAMVYNAGGTTADEQTSVYILRSTDDGASLVVGNDGNIVFDEDPAVIEKVVNPGTDNKTYPAYYTSVTGYVGLQVASTYDAARIANIHPTDASAQLTDDMIFEALAFFKAGKQPNMICMNRQALKMLRQSRTATNATGAPAPRPTEVEGIPIVVTDGILSTEAVEV